VQDSFIFPEDKKFPGKQFLTLCRDKVGFLTGNPKQAI
jgi:hypothetical protein